MAEGLSRYPHGHCCRHCREKSFRSQFLMKFAGLLPQQHSQTISGRLQSRLQGRYLGTGGFQESQGFLHRKFVDDSLPGKAIAFSS